MFWIVNSSLLCPYTKTAFTHIQTMKNLRLVIWYKPTILLQPGDIIYPVSRGLMINDVFHRLTVLKIHPFSRAWWGTLKNGLRCPGNQQAMTDECSMSQHCCFSVCPRRQ